jgi:cell division topological specificity factor
MIDFLRKLFGGVQPSSATAKERLRLVLMTDHLALAPELIEQMKHDLVDVISRYVEVDRDKIEVNFEQQDKALAMLANIPILSVNRPNANGSGNHPEAEPETAAVAAATAPGDASGVPPTRRRRKRRRAAQTAAQAATLAPNAS